MWIQGKYEDVFVVLLACGDNGSSGWKGDVDGRCTVVVEDLDSRPFKLDLVIREEFNK